VTFDYSQYRSLGRALRGEGRRNPLKLVAGTALPASAELPAMPPVALPDDDDDAAPAVPVQTHVPVRSGPLPAAAPRIDPVAELLAALDAAPNDLERGYLLASASVDVREGLSGALAYRALVAPQPDVALDSLVAALDSAADDDHRAALLSAASRELRAALADRLWWRRPPVRDGQQRYLDMIK
jgi:hypothetical protein